MTLTCDRIDPIAIPNNSSPTSPILGHRSPPSLSRCTPLPLCLLWGCASRNSSVFLLPVGFLVSNAGCYLLSIWPIQPTHFLFISISMGPCFVCWQSSKLLMVSGQGILRVRGRQLFMKVWTFLVVFFVVLSDPYSKTDFTFELKIPILVWVAISWLSICFWVGERLLLPCQFVLWLLPPWIFTMLLRYVKAKIYFLQTIFLQEWIGYRWQCLIPGAWL